MLQKKKYTTTTTRFASVIYIKDFSSVTKSFLYKKKNNNNLKKKLFYKKTKISALTTIKYNAISVTCSYVYNKKPFQVFFSSIGFFNQTILTPAVDNLLPGRKLYDLTLDFVYRKARFLGSKVCLEDLPYHIFTSNLINNKQNKTTFIKSSGTFGLRVKGKKTIKLILIKLPSEKIYFFIKKSTGIIGKNTNFFNNKFIEGKWGFSIKTSKKLVVRGVAMNPVDHPNGGRTKAKQPEKSPWGWIAKQKK